MIIALAAAVLAGITLIAYLTASEEAPPPVAKPPIEPPIAPVPVTKKQLAALPKATTFARLKDAEKDQTPHASATGQIIHPKHTKVVYTTPGGPPLAVLPTTQLDNPTWLPVLETRPGWTRVLLPTRPNGATGWLHTADNSTKQTTNPYEVRVDLSDRRLTLMKDAKPTGSWPVAVGAPATPTPTGRTFLLASLAPPEVTYSPLILPLGAHSDVLQTYEGGPGTIGIHGWPDPSVFGKALSHGCIRLPAQALTTLSHLPLGTTVLVSA
ncbi:L,D-transpeptidase family protein [Sphaerisporangium sp. B11E5]|uniref:L,D-transpeptidase n=1 Tax=Sphaerisporangium sp. B11E5 TaxID=3153563 RepID=UPI00325ED18A